MSMTLPMGPLCAAPCPMEWERGRREASGPDSADQSVVRVWGEHRPPPLSRGLNRIAEFTGLDNVYCKEETI